MKHTPTEATSWKTSTGLPRLYPDAAPRTETKQYSFPAASPDKLASACSADDLLKLATGAGRGGAALLTLLGSRAHVQRICSLLVERCGPELRQTLARAESAESQRDLALDENAQLRQELLKACATLASERNAHQEARGAHQEARSAHQKLLDAHAALASEHSAHQEARNVHQELREARAALAIERDAHQVTMSWLQEAESIARREIAGRYWAMGAYLQVSTENVHLRHQLEGSTPAAIQGALAREARIDDDSQCTDPALEHQLFDDQFDETEVVEMPLPARGAAL